METEVKQNTEVITYENAFIALKKYFLDKNESNVQDLIELIQVGFDSTKEKEGANGAFVGGSNTPNFDFINNYHEIPSGFRDQKEVMIDAVKSLNGMMRWHHPSTLQNITPTPSLVSLAISTLVSAYNPNLISLKNCPNYIIGYNMFDVDGCTKLNSLEGCPKEVGGDFWCRHCKRKFPKKEVQSLCDVKGKVVV
jgi:hypothetical protein